MARLGARLGVPLVLLLLVCAAYFPTLGNGFIWDDNEYITGNTLLNDAGGLRAAWLDPSSFFQYYPLTLTTFWVEKRLWGLDPRGYHATNLLLHTVNAVLIWVLLRLLAVPGAALVAGLFALHPVHVESVAWVTERKNLLSGICYLGAALSYFAFSPPGAEDSARRRWAFYPLAFVLFAFALFSKTVTSTLPAALLLVRWWKRGRLRPADLFPLLPFLVLGIALGLQTARLERTTVGAFGAAWDYGLLERVLIAGRAVCFYAGKLFWPHPLVFVYPRWTIDAGAWWQHLFPAAVAAAGLALWGLRGRLGRGPVTGFLFFVGTLFPALGFFNVYPMRYSFVADHFQYLASIGPLTLATAAACAAAGRAPATARRFGPILAALGAGTLLLLTWRQTHVYRDEETLWRATLAANPRAFLARGNLGRLLVARGEFAEARMHLEDAVRLDPDGPEPHYWLAVVRYQQRDPRGAVAELDETLRLDEKYVDAVLLRGRVLCESGRFRDGLASLERYLSLKPDSPQRSYVLGLITFFRTQAAGPGGAPALH